MDHSCGSHHPKTQSHPRKKKERRCHLSVGTSNDGNGDEGRNAHTVHPPGRSTSTGNPHADAHARGLRFSNIQPSSFRLCGDGPRGSRYIFVGGRLIQSVWRGKQSQVIYTLSHGMATLRERHAWKVTLTTYKHHKTKRV